MPAEDRRGREVAGDRRVLQIMRMTGVSGSENHLVELVAGLREAGWRSDVLIPSPAPGRLTSFTARLRAAGAGVSLLKTQADVSPALVRAAQRGLRHYDVVHTHLIHADWHAALASLAARGGVLVSTKHNHDPFRARPPVRWIERAACTRCAEVIAISASLAGFTRAFAGRQPNIVRYGLAAGPPPPPVRLDPQAPRLIAVGRLVEQKGYDVLLRAMATVVRRVPGAALAIIGDGPLRSRLLRWIDAFGLPGCVRLLGVREDVPALIRQADLLVHAARWEGFGLVLLEAMREGRPVVATRVGAVPEVVEDAVTGDLVAPGDPDALATAIVHAVARPDRAARMGMEGRLRLETRFTRAHMARETAEVYASALRVALTR